MQLLSQSESKKKVFKLNLRLTPKQAEIDASTARFKIVRCGRKFGKTTYAEKKALDWLSPPNSVVWYISPTIKQGKIIAWTEFKRMIPQEALGKKPNDTDLIITLKNGSQLYLMGADDPDSLRGPAPNGVIFEEAAFIRREAWHEVVRPNLAPKKAPALFIGTPKGYNWFYDLEEQAKKNPEEWATFHFSIYDNPHIDKDEIEACRKSCDTPAVWNQEYMAEYESSVGRVFGSFSDSHCIHIPIPETTFDAYRAIDWGMRDNTGALWGRAINGKLYIYREYAENNLSAPAQAQIIKNQTSTKENILRTAISHDAAKEDPAMKGLTVLWHFRQAGISPLTPSSRDKKHSRAMINQLLQEKRLFIDKYKCPKLKKQMLAYEWKDTSMEKPEDGDDDLVDALHYLVEMLQFDLFMKRTKTDILSDKEIYADIAREKLSQQIRKFEIPLGRRDDEFGNVFEDTKAGYL